MRDTSFHGMAGLLWVGTSQPVYESVTHVSEHLLPMSPVRTNVNQVELGGHSDRQVAKSSWRSSDNLPPSSGQSMILFSGYSTMPRAPACLGCGTMWRTVF